MPIEIIPTFIMYSAVSAITPGPANLCSLASAISYGRKKALRLPPSRRDRPTCAHWRQPFPTDEKRRCVNGEGSSPDSRSFL